MSSRDPRPEGGEPGSLTSLVDEVFRGPTDSGRSAWVDGLAPGAAVGRYDLIREIGRGGFGVVWEARDRELGRRVAVKVIRVQRGAAPEQRLVAEAEVAARLSHPGIVTVLDVGRNEKGAWLVLEYLSGRTLAARLEEGAIPLREAVRICLDVARALAHAHAHGVVHRDLTDRNVFLCASGQVKLLDLGMAQAFGRRKLEGGTPDAMAPEQARGAPEDERVDVYALGVLAWRMVTGRSPFPADLPADRRLAPRLDTPEAPALGELVDRMLAPDPMDRPRDASAVVADLEQIEAALPRSSTGTTPGTVRVRRRWPRWVAVSAGVAALAVAAGAGTTVGRRSAGADPIGAPVAFGVAGTAIACNWGRATWYDLDRVPEGAVVRHGDMGDAAVAEVEGRKAFLVTSDWGQIFLPLGVAATGDTFAVEVEVHVPPPSGFMRGAHLAIFTEPAGTLASGEHALGVSIGITEEPGKPPTFQWFEPDGKGGHRTSYLGVLAEPFSGRWRVLRIEGSRTRGWYRALIDGRTVVVAQGRYDLSGSRVLLGAGYGYMNPENVAFSNLRTFAGTPECQ